MLRIKTQRLPHLDYVYGVHYEFEDRLGVRYTDTKWVNDLQDTSRGSTKTVYYLPDQPEKNLLVL